MRKNHNLNLLQGKIKEEQKKVKMMKDTNHHKKNQKGHYNSKNKEKKVPKSLIGKKKEEEQKKVKMMKNINHHKKN